MRKLTLLFCFLSTALFSQPFDLEDIMSAPYCSELAASPYDNAIAWVSNAQGVRNIWMAYSSYFEPRKLTDYRDDDGHAITNLTFTPDKRSVLYQLGGSPNRNGEFPNPTSHPKEAKRSIVQVSTNGGRPFKLADGYNPVVSPDGKHMLYSYKGKIWIKNLEKFKNPGKQLFNARGTLSDYSFSNDGEKVLFLSNRGTHNLVGIYDTQLRTIQWLAPGVGRDATPIWSPDNRRIAFIRTPGQRKGELFDLTGANPFSIWVVDVATGASGIIWASPNKNAGGFAQYYPEHPLRWAGNDDLVFYSEHEGWLHIYKINILSKQVADLTPGDCEAEHSSVSPDGRWLYVSHNCLDIDGRQLSRIDIRNGKATILSETDELATNPVAMSDSDWIAYRKATYNTPPTITAMRATGSSAKKVFPEQLPRRFPDNKQVKPRVVTYNSEDGTPVHAQLFYPEDMRAGERRPAIIFMHGGPIRQMLPGWHYSGYYANAYAMNQYLCSKGYIVMSINFRAGIGYGQAFRRAPQQGPRGASEYQDVVAAGRYLQNRLAVDRTKIGLWGGSYGGYLTAMGLARNSDLFAAGVDIHGVHDWSWRAEDFSPGGAWGITEDLLDLAFRSSPVSDLSRWRSPILLIHGDDDRNVMFGQTVDLVQRLRDHQVQQEILVLPDEVHGFLRYESWLKVFKSSARFFDKHLRQ